MPGSAYLTTLLALVVLTIVGVTLVLITQTEMGIGAADRSVQRVLYATESGIAAAMARALVTSDHSAFEMELPDGGDGGGAELTHQLRVSPVYPLYQGFCNLCAINQDAPFRRVVFGVSSSGVRQGGDRVLGARSVGVTVAVEPWVPSPEAVSLFGDESLEELRF